MDTNVSTITATLLNLDEGHRVASPLGAWIGYQMLKSAGKENRAQASRMLSGDHPVITDELTVAGHAWAQPLHRDAALSAMFGDESLVSTPMPTNKELNAWVSEKTNGLITEVPIMVSPSDLMTLLTTVYMKLTWNTPFTVSDSSNPKHRISKSVKEAWDVDTYLSDTLSGEDDLFLVRWNGSLFAVLAKNSAASTVYSVLSPEKSGADAVLLAEMLNAFVSGAIPSEDRVSVRNTRDVPTLRALTDEAIAAGLPLFAFESAQRIATVTAPAWEANSTIGLPTDDDRVEGKQTTVASYTAEGFEAASITQFLTRAALLQNTEIGIHLDVERPHLCAAYSKAYTELPAFIAWVEQAAQA